jgi:hypothetical protein
LPPVVPAPVPASAAAPYGRALSALRHNHDAKIKSYFESRGFGVNIRPEAASIALVFKELCAMRASGALPNEARWFELSATWFTDTHEKPFKDFIRKLYNVRA